jgi:putative addiction module killer protein
VIEIRTTAQFSEWFTGLRDRNARVRIQARIDRAELGNLGDCQPVGMASLKCEFITPQVIGYISFSMARC